MARIGMMGGEHNDVTDGIEVVIGAGHTIVTSPVNGSRYAWKMLSDGATSPYARFPHGNSSAGKVFYKFDFYPVSATGYLCQFAYDSTKRGSIRFVSGALKLYTSGGSAIGAASAVPTDSAWNTIQCYYDSATGDGEFYLNGVFVDTQNLSAGGLNINNIYLGQFAPSAGTCYFDNVIVNDDNGADENTYPDVNERFVVLYPNATMTEPATTGGGAGSLYFQTSAGAATSGTSSNWNTVEETAPDGDTSYIRKNSNNEFRDWYVIENIADVGYPAAGDTVNVLAVGGYVGGNGTTNRYFRYIYETAGGGTGIQRTGNLDANVNAYFMYQQGTDLHYSPLVTYPSAELGSDLDTYQIGWEADDANSRQIKGSAFWLEVSYIPEVVAGPRLLASLGVGK